METQLTIRLPSELSEKILRRAKSLKLKRSDVVRLAIADFLEGPEESDSPYERIKMLAGSIRTGIPDLGQRHREHLIRKLKRG